MGSPRSWGVHTRGFGLVLKEISCIAPAPSLSDEVWKSAGGG